MLIYFDLTKTKYKRQNGFINCVQDSKMISNMT